MTTLKEHGLFSSRDTLEEALQYGEELIAARVEKGSRMEAFTAMHVVSNTAIRLLAKTSLTEVLPYSDTELDELLLAKPKISSLSQEEALRLLRTKLPEFTLTAYTAHKHGFSLAQELSAFALLGAQTFGLTIKDLTNEVAARVAANKGIK